MITAIIIDDEKPCVETLEWQLKTYCPQVNLIGATTKPEDGLAMILKEQPDVVFLDIEMPMLNGFELIQRLGKVDSNIIFTTAYDRFAVKAFKFCALDYLLKPIDETELTEAVAKVEEKVHANTYSEQIQMLLTKMSDRSKPLKKIALPTLKGIVFVEANEIVHCDSESNYTYVFLSNGDSILVSKTLKEIEELLSDHNFYRVHHSHLVNLDKIERYIKGNGGYVEMSNGKSISVARSKKEGLLQNF